MGVSGSGKSRIGSLLSADLEIPFYDGDDFHSKSSIKKMTAGVALQDEDRWPWLDRLAEIANENSESGCIIACSALKRVYREHLRSSYGAELIWVWLHGSFDQILSRLRGRQGHFMGADMLQSQFDTLEAPDNAFEVDISSRPEEIVEQIKTQLK